MEPIALSMPNQVRPPSLQEMFAMFLREQKEQLDEWESPEDADDFEEDWNADTLDLSAYQIAMMDQDDNPPGADPDAPLSPDPAQAVPNPQITPEAPPAASGSLSAQSSDATQE